MKSYYEILDGKARQLNVSLKEVFELAGLPSSTYYRIAYGQDMRYKTAVKINEKLRALQEADRSNR